MGIIILVSYFYGDLMAGLFTGDKEVIAAAEDYLKSYSVDIIIVGLSFSMMGYLNGCGKTGFIAFQGILSTFLVRIPVSYCMSKIPGVTLFQIGFATPLTTVFAIILSSCYIVAQERKGRKLYHTDLYD